MIGLNSPHWFALFSHHWAVGFVAYFLVGAITLFVVTRPRYRSPPNGGILWQRKDNVRDGVFLLFSAGDIHPLILGVDCGTLATVVFAQLDFWTRCQRVIR